jgi:hypothetical protein
MYTLEKLSSSSIDRPRPAHHRGQGVVVDMHHERALLRDELIQPLQERSAPGQKQPVGGDVRHQLGRSLLQGAAHCGDNGGHGFLDGLAHMGVGQHDRLRVTVNQILPRNRYCMGSARGTADAIWILAASAMFSPIKS